MCPEEKEKKEGKIIRKVEEFVKKDKKKESEKKQIPSTTIPDIPPKKKK